MYIKIAKISEPFHTIGGKYRNSRSPVLDWINKNNTTIFLIKNVHISISNKGFNDISQIQCLNILFNKIICH